MGLLQMASSKPLAGRAILVVENERLIALEMVEGLRLAGASVLAAHSLREGLLCVRPDFNAAVVDIDLGDGDGKALCERLVELGVPFVVHSGLLDIDGACRSGVVLPKPATTSQLVRTVEKLLAQ